MVNIDIGLLRVVRGKHPHLSNLIQVFLLTFVKPVFDRVINQNKLLPASPFLEFIYNLLVFVLNRSQSFLF